MRVTIVPYVTGRPTDPYLGTPTGDRLERDLRGEPQLSGDMAAYARAAPKREREADPDRPGLFDAIGGAR